ncbi:hypothetical protein BU14_2578s0001 [Porphyra umbilicalis]|uniref:Uncharacterized protein n=1 Tax=Porphyra umbilicalis TaxID=2786 RepID=A0A1X6NIV5_PORUM|nr:hypothetical protein BU14_2578s0001 [Porphyra umbilicalis]|eukprot:OSX68561.1 hypothetical protein BU14_2578s0001 [Porphyra umbilicalis]
MESGWTLTHLRASARCLCLLLPLFLQLARVFSASCVCTCVSGACRCDYRGDSKRPSPWPCPPQPLRMVGRTTLVYTAMGGIFASVEDTMSSLRDGRKDIWNGAVAGCAAGMVFGVNSQKLSVGAGMCATLAATSAFLEAVNLTLGPAERVPADVKLAKQWGLAPPAAEPATAKEE